MAKPSAATKSQKRRRPKKRRATPINPVMIGNGVFIRGSLAMKADHGQNRADR